MNPKVPKLLQSTHTKTERPQPRLYHLDNFRSYLTALVIYHHASVPYGGGGSWFYKSPLHTPDTSLPLLTFNALNQCYFMGSFFFLSGLMSAQTLRRKGRKEFLMVKCVKLGIPTVTFTLFGPLMQHAAVMFWREDSTFPLRWESLWRYWIGLRGVRGPVWYCALLLIFDTIYTVWPTVLPTFTQRFSASVFWPTMMLTIATDFLIRLIYPVGAVFVPLNVKPAYLAQYIACYIFGTLSFPSNSTANAKENTLPSLSLTARIFLLAASILSTVLLVTLFSLYPATYPLSSLHGGFNLMSLLYSIWNDTTGYLLGSSLLSLFSEKSWLNRKWGSVGRYSYAAFLVHPIVLVEIQGMFDLWRAGFWGGNGVVVKAAVVGTLGCVGSWGVAWVVMKIPGVRAIIG